MEYEAKVVFLYKSPVSYTHLDCISNDSKYGSLRIRGRILFGFQAVSYTHLDVYKRQVNFNEEAIRSQIETVRREREALIPGCSSCASAGGRNDEYDMTCLLYTSKLPHLSTSANFH